MLVKYEFQKLLRKRSTRLILAASMLITAFLFGLPILQFQPYDQNGPIKGLAGTAYQKAQVAEYSVPLTEDYVQESIQQVQQLFDDPANVGYDGYEAFLIDEAYWDSIAPRESLLGMIAQTYADPHVSVGYNALADLDTAQAPGFYAARQEKIGKILDTPSRELTQEQKAYWQRKNSQVEEPFQYGYYEGWKTILSCFELLLFALLAVCLIIAPVFSGEYQAGTDAVLLSARYGKTKLTRAKILASYLFATLAFTLHVLVAFGLPLAAFGVEGWDLPLQIANTIIPYPFTFLEATLVSLGVVYLVLFALVGLTLWLSARLKSPYLVLVVLIPVLLLPMFPSATGTTGLYNLLFFLLPYRALIPELGKYLTYQLGGLVLDAFSMRALLYALLSLVLIPLAGRGWKKHQVM